MGAIDSNAQERGLQAASTPACAPTSAKPTATILDSQSVKSDGHGGAVGYDAAKRIKGRKRHLLVDTLGPIPGVAVTPASTPERNGAQVLLGRAPGWFTWLPRRWVAERTLGWLMRQRRLVRDDEGTERSAEA